MKVQKSDVKGVAAIKIETDGSYVQLSGEGDVKKLEKAKITLNDCLACSGCITSAESVLITQQSQTEVYKVLDEGKKVVVVSVSPQSRASIAANYDLSIEEVASKLNAFFKALGVSYVFDTTFSKDLALIESGREFVKRFKSKTDLPMLASACPGWICYAEKTHGNFILPFISSTKSPQQIMGSLIKDYYARTLGKRPDDIYHVTVMPCYDKKLEASRSDFYNDIYRTRDVDCVLTSGEVIEMVKEKGIDFLSLSSLSAPVDSPFSLHPSNLYSHAGSGSGGYLEHIFKYAAFELFGQTVDKITYVTLRNKDFKEVTLQVDGQPVLKFAAAHGFRNIQNLVQKMKRRRCTYHYVEVMACPSGCLNGGGQIKPSPGEDTKERLTKVEMMYNSTRIRNPEDNPVVEQVYREWLESNEENISRLLHTKYHYVEKNTSALAIKW